MKLLLGVGEWPGEGDLDVPAVVVVPWPGPADRQTFFPLSASTSVTTDWRAPASTESRRARQQRCTTPHNAPPASVRERLDRLDATDSADTPAGRAQWSPTLPAASARPWIPMPLAGSTETCCMAALTGFPRDRRHLCPYRADPGGGRLRQVRRGSRRTRFSSEDLGGHLPRGWDCRGSGSSASMTSTSVSRLAGCPSTRWVRTSCGTSRSWTMSTAVVTSARPSEVRDDPLPAPQARTRVRVQEGRA